MNDESEYSLKVYLVLVIANETIQAILVYGMQLEGKD